MKLILTHAALNLEQDQCYGHRGTESLFRPLAHGCKSPSELLELCDWGEEPGLIDLIRGIAAMREDVRSAIEAFIALSGDARSASADLDGRGVLTLASAGTAALARYLAVHDADELSRLPH